MEEGITSERAWKAVSWERDAIDMLVRLLLDGKVGCLTEECCSNARYMYDCSP